jgi:hypothetical protein
MKVEVQLYYYFYLSARREWVVKVTPRAALPPEERPGTHSTGVLGGGQDRSKRERCFGTVINLYLFTMKF